MLLQTNSYVVPHDKRTEHVKLLARFRQTLLRLGCDSFEVYEQVGPNWNASQTSGRFVQIMRFRDRRHQQAVQQAERTDPMAQKLIAEFCELINFQYQQQQSLFATSFYTGLFSGDPPMKSDLQRSPLEEQENAVPSEPSVFSQEELTATPPPVVGEAPIVNLEAAPPTNAPQFTDVAISAQRPEELGPEDDVLDGKAEPIGREDEQSRFETESTPKARSQSEQAPRSLIEPLEERSVHAPQDDGFESLLDEMDEH
ncbi:MAG TPA: hypothetical protein VFW23_02310 [Tepidisphaeraceae bacterium]|nr:hypothetical protein [Tepidisphaeraceae bacterium]